MKKRRPRQHKTRVQTRVPVLAAHGADSVLPDVLREYGTIQSRVKLTDVSAGSRRLPQDPADDAPEAPGHRARITAIA